MHIVILGNGFAGVSALETIRKHDKEAQITLISGEEGGFYSPASLFAYLEDRVKKADLFLRKPEDYDRQGVRTLFGTKAVRLDAAGKTVSLDDRTHVTYDRLLVATGASAPIHEISGSASRGVFKLDTLADADEIRAHRGRRVAIIGAGRVGVELAAVLSELGAQVTLLEAASKIVPTVFDEEIANLVQERLTSHGVNVRLNERVVRLSGNPVNCVETEQGEVPCDMVVIAIGRRPNVGFAKGQVSIGETGGIAVNEYLQAGQDVYAAGDCAETWDFVGCRTINGVIPTALETGRIAALNIMGTLIRYTGSINANVMIVFNRAYFSIGLVTGNKMTKQAGDKTHMYISRNGRLVGAQFAGDVAEAAQALSAVRRAIRVDGDLPFDGLRRRLFVPRVFPNANR
jgi:NADPH-dependent 2,4-dienoyl-CoA reductase/sulfur reductase-like enzyme